MKTLVSDYLGSRSDCATRWISVSCVLSVNFLILEMGTMIGWACLGGEFPGNYIQECHQVFSTTPGT